MFHPISRSTLAATAVATLALAGCSTDAPVTTPTGETTAPLTAVTVVTHDSFAVPDQVLADFEARSGLTVTFVAPGDAGSLVNQLILTKDAPLGDVVYGVDNTFASRAGSEGVFAPYESAAPAAADALAYQAAGLEGLLTAIDFSDVCINIDHTWFADAGLDEPTTLDDLTDPAYSGLLSVPNPATSSPGLAFLMATIAAQGDNWVSYWSDLRSNDVRVVAGWSDAYYSDFSGPSSGGDYPLVVSYASSPPFEVGDDGVSTTSALLDTCFRQVEYAGVLAGAQNPDGAAMVIDWMLSDEFQASLPENMYVYPVSSSVAIPDYWAEHGPLATNPWSLAPSEIDANRDDWINQWTATVID
ncbi:MAG: thiamine ABC transporter substrate-binding protein [Actinobacteria bacterium HGW-Actinobacteria-4]|nr:MAG: thiamine ABC transporter substrate-binding protein [Actinobacteria bacterium HGW-Actinobacteria-4]